MMFIDTHTHLYFPDFNEDRNDVFNRARAAGVSGMINIGTDLQTSRAAIDLANQADGIFASVGIHPHDASLFSRVDRMELESLFELEKVVAIGEVGLDYFRNLSSRQDQTETFRYFLGLHNRLKLPLVVHVRDAFEDVLRLVREEVALPVRGVIHCFSGDEEVLRQVIELGFYVSFAGQVTYKKNEGLRACAQKVPADRLLLETDAPFLAPQSKRGKRNEPAYLLETAQCVADARQMSLEALARVTTENAVRLFRLPDVFTGE